MRSSPSDLTLKSGVAPCLPQKIRQKERKKERERKEKERGMAYITLPGMLVSYILLLLLLFGSDLLFLLLDYAG